MVTGIRALPFLFGEAFTSLRRHSLMTIAAVTTIAVALTLMSSFAITLYEVGTAAHRAVSDFEMRVFCRENVPKKQLHGIRLRLEAIPGVARPVGYVSREKAFKESLKNLPIDTTDIPNRFNETFVLKLTDPARAPAIAREIRGWQDIVQEVALPEEEMSGALRIAGVVRVVGIGAGIGLLLCALVVVSNTVRASMEARKGELRIMQIVGASPWFIRFPLFVEGLVHGIVGGGIASLALAVTSHYINGFIVQTIPMMARYFDIALPPLPVAAAIVGAGALIGASGSLFSMRRYLKAA